MINETIDYLGRRGRDRVTGAEGVVESVAFDLYGCVTVILRPSVGDDGKHRDTHWLDISRVELLGDERVMPVPAFVPKVAAQPKTYGHGAAAKPMPR